VFDPVENNIQVTFDPQAVRASQGKAAVPLLRSQPAAKGPHWRNAVVMHGKTIQAEACTSRNECGSGSDDYRGGILITAPDGPCTSGFVATENTDVAPKHYLLTAGHCGGILEDEVAVVGGSSLRFRQSTNTWFIANQRDDGRLVGDAVAVEIPANKVSNWVYKNNSNKAFSITSRDTVGHRAVGSTVCMAARVHYYRCGTVLPSTGTTNISPFPGVPAVPVMGMVLWSFSSPGNTEGLGSGSSGAPVFLWRHALGIHSGSDGGSYEHEVRRTVYTAAFSKIRFIEGQLNVTVRTS